MKPPHRMMRPLHTIRQLLFNLKLLTGWRQLLPPPPPPLHMIIRRLCGVSGRAACCLLLLLLAGRMIEAQAQETVLVSNTAANSFVKTARRTATKFTTGTSATGYTISSAGLSLKDAPSSGTVTVTIRDGSGTDPGTVLATLSNPDALTANAINTFTAPTNTVLAASTAYFLAVEPGNGLTVDISFSNDETGAAGWSIANDSREGNDTWGDASYSLKFSVSGTANPAPTVSLAAAVSTIIEGGTALTLTATRSEMNTSGDTLFIPIQVKSTGTTAQAIDYALGADSISILNNSDTGMTTFSATEDSADEQNETVVIELGTLPEGNNRAVDNDEVTITITDNDPTIVSLSRVGGGGAVSEGKTTELVINLNRRLIAGEIIDVPLSISGTALSTTDYSLARKLGSDFNTGVILVDSTSAELIVRFSGANAQAANLILTPLIDNEKEAENFFIRLGPDGNVANGFDRPGLATNVGGGANPHGRNNNIFFSVNDTPAPAAPTGLTATAGNAQVSLNWTAPNNNTIDDYQYRQKAGTGNYGNWTAIPNSDAATTIHTITGLTNGTIYAFQLRARADIAEGTASTEVTATPMAVLTNAAPTVMNRIPDQTATVGTAFRYQFSENTFNDTNGDALTYTATRGDDTALPAWLRFDANSRTFSGTPQAGDAGTLSVKVTADDRKGGMASDVFDIVVPAIPPRITITGGTAVTEGKAAAFTLSASHMPASYLTVNLSVAEAAGSDFVIPGSEDMITAPFRSVSDRAGFTIATVDDDTDEHSGSVTVTVAPGTGYTVGTPSSASVTVNDNDPTKVVLTTPDVITTEGSSSDSATLKLTLNRPLRAGERLQVPLTFSSGTVGTDFTLSLSGSPTGVMLSGSTVTFNGSAGGSAMVAHVLMSASQDNDTDDETVTVSIPTGTTGTPRLTATGLGGGATGSRTGNGQITLKDDNVPPSNSAPTVMNRIPDQTATVGTAYSYQVPENTFNDTDGDPLTYAAAQNNDPALPTWLTFNKGTRTFSGTPQAGDAGTLSIKVTADDKKGGTVSDVFDIVVSPAAPVVPVITITAGTSPVIEGTAALFTVTATLAPSANLTVKLTVAEAGGGDFVASGNEGMKTVTIPAASGSLTYTVTTINDDTDEPNGSVTVTVANGTGYTVGTPSEATVTVNDDDDDDGEEMPLGAEGDAAEALIFPNPSGDYLEVRSSVEGTFKILSLSGRPLMEGTTNTRIDITTLQSGLYFVQLSDSSLLKFVRE